MTLLASATTPSSEKNSEQQVEKEEEDFVVETEEEEATTSVLEVIGDELELHYFQEKEVNLMESTGFLRKILRVQKRIEKSRARD